MPYYSLAGLEVAFEDVLYIYPITQGDKYRQKTAVGNQLDDSAVQFYA